MVDLSYTSTFINVYEYNVYAYIIVSGLIFTYRGIYVPTIVEYLTVYMFAEIERHSSFPQMTMRGGEGVPSTQAYMIWWECLIRIPKQAACVIAPMEDMLYGHCGWTVRGVSRRRECVHDAHSLVISYRFHGSATGGKHMGVVLCRNAVYPCLLGVGKELGHDKLSKNQRVKRGGRKTTR